VRSRSLTLPFSLSRVAFLACTFSADTPACRPPNSPHTLSLPLFLLLLTKRQLRFLIYDRTRLPCLASLPALPACLSLVLPACLYPCLRTCLSCPACLTLPACLPACLTLPTCLTLPALPALPTLPALPLVLPALPLVLPAYLPCLPTCLRLPACAYLPAPTCLRLPACAYLPVCLPACLLDRSAQTVCWGLLRGQVGAVQTTPLLKPLNIPWLLGVWHGTRDEEVCCFPVLRGRRATGKGGNQLPVSGYCPNGECSKWCDDHCEPKPAGDTRSLGYAIPILKSEISVQLWVSNCWLRCEMWGVWEDGEWNLGDMCIIQ